MVASRFAASCARSASRGPLFWLERGPRVTGALFVDYGNERVDLARADRDARLNTSHLVMGFAIGSAF